MKDARRNGSKGRAPRERGRGRVLRTLVPVGLLLIVPVWLVLNILVDNWAINRLCDEVQPAMTEAEFRVVAREYSVDYLDERAQSRAAVAGKTISAVRQAPFGTALCVASFDAHGRLVGHRVSGVH